MREPKSPFPYQDNSLWRLSGLKKPVCLFRRTGSAGPTEPRRPHSGFRRRRVGQGLLTNKSLLGALLRRTPRARRRSERCLFTIGSERLSQGKIICPMEDADALRGSSRGFPWTALFLLTPSFTRFTGTDARVDEPGLRPRPLARATSDRCRV